MARQSVLLLLAPRLADSAEPVLGYLIGNQMQNEQYGYGGYGNGYGGYYIAMVATKKR